MIGGAEMVTWAWQHLVQNKVAYVAPVLVLGFMEFQIMGLDDEVRKLNQRGLIQYIIDLDQQLCMNPGNPQLLQIIAESIAEYEEDSGQDFPIPLRCANAG